MPIRLQRVGPRKFTEALKWILIATFFFRQQIPPFSIGGCAQSHPYDQLTHSLKITEIEKCDVVPRDIYLILGIILGASRVDTCA